MNYVAIVAVFEDRAEKFQEFDAQANADAHVAEHGGFVFHNAGGWNTCDMWIDGQTVTLVPLKRPGTDVNAERDRRIEAGAEFTLSTGTVIAITGREQDKTALMSQYLAAQARDAAGETGADMVYRDRANVNRLLTPQEMIELFTLGMAWVEAVMTVAWHMKDGTGAHSAGIPDDLENDSYWP